MEVTAFAALLIAFSIVGCLGDTAVFLDSKTTPYLKSITPSGITGTGLEALLSALSNNPVAFSVGKSVSAEIDSFLVSTVFQRPSIVWSLAVVGATKQDFYREQGKFVEVIDTPAEVLKPSFLRISEDCKLTCVTESFQQLVDHAKASFEKGSIGLNGHLMAPSFKAPLFLNSHSLFFWAMELSELWRTVTTLFTEHQHEVVDLKHTLTGLYFVRQEFGEHSTELEAALEFTKTTITSLQLSLADRVDGQLFTALLLHDHVEDLPRVDQWQIALNRHSRSLMSSVSNSDNETDPRIVQKTKRFATNSVGYVMFLVIAFFTLCSIYALSNMDFTKDTLLYSQAKID